MAKEKMQIGTEGIYDARQLGIPKMLILGFQHMFAMFGATVLVPLLTGLDVATTLLMAGLGTLLFHLITGMRFRLSWGLPSHSWAGTAPLLLWPVTVP